jgi:hypothetical protein
MWESLIAQHNVLWTEPLRGKLRYSGFRFVRAIAAIDSPAVNSLHGGWVSGALSDEPPKQNSGIPFNAHKAIALPNLPV